MEITLRVVLKRPTPGVDFGLQKGRGRPFETIQKQRSTGRDLQFELPVTVKADKDGKPDFFGPFVQGRRGDRSLYINIGTYAGQSNACWSRRLKIPLSRITSDLIDSSSTLLAEIPGTARDGGPSCAYSWLKCLDRPWQWQGLTKNKK